MALLVFFRSLNSPTRVQHQRLVEHHRRCSRCQSRPRFITQATSIFSYGAYVPRQSVTYTAFSVDLPGRPGPIIRPSPSDPSSDKSSRDPYQPVLHRPVDRLVLSVFVLSSLRDATHYCVGPSPVEDTRLPPPPFARIFSTHIFEEFRNMCGCAR